MKPRRLSELLSGLVGRVVAQIICWAMMLAIIGIGARAFMWLDENVSGGIDPVYFVLVVALAFIGFSAWRTLASANLDE